MVGVGPQNSNKLDCNNHCFKYDEMRQDRSAKNEREITLVGVGSPNSNKLDCNNYCFKYAKIATIKAEIAIEFEIICGSQNFTFSLNCISI